MKQAAASDQAIIKYLLNEMSAEDQERFEEAYLEDGNFFEQLQALEEELIEDYVKGDLSSHDRHRFERHYLASEQRRARIETARQLVQVSSINSTMQAAAEDRSGSRFFTLRTQLAWLVNRNLATGFGVAAVLLLLLGTGLFIELLRLRGQLVAVREERAALERRAEESERRLVYEQEQTNAERKQAGALRGELENLHGRLDRLERDRSQTAKDQVYSLALTAGVRDIGNPDRAVISAHTRFVELRIKLERQDVTNLRSYRAVVKTVEGGREIWNQGGIRLQGSGSDPYVIVRAPATRFNVARAQDFMLSLSALTAEGNGYEELESYYFQVILK